MACVNTHLALRIGAPLFIVWKVHAIFREGLIADTRTVDSWAGPLAYSHNVIIRSTSLDSRRMRFCFQCVVVVFLLVVSDTTLESRLVNCE